MGLSTDKIFFNILRSNTACMETIGGRIYNTVIGKPEEEELNEPVPYVIIMFAGMKNNEGTKDSIYEGPTDTVNIEIELAANDEDELTDIAMDIRRIIYQAMINKEVEGTQLIEDYTFSTKDKTHDYIKPCEAIILEYQCEVTNTLRTYE